MPTASIHHRRLHEVADIVLQAVQRWEQETDKQSPYPTELLEHPDLPADSPIRECTAMELDAATEYLIRCGYVIVPKPTTDPPKPGE